MSFNSEQLSYEQSTVVKSNQPLLFLLSNPEDKNVAFSEYNNHLTLHTHVAKILRDAISFGFQAELLPGMQKLLLQMTY